MRTRRNAADRSKAQTVSRCMGDGKQHEHADVRGKTEMQVGSVVDRGCWEKWANPLMCACLVDRLQFSLEICPVGGDLDQRLAVRWRKITQRQLKQSKTWLNICTDA